tara:strand:+ start:602 stop:1402 length:801 start_codon:yes stop_codon:yes gene_type:complete
MRITESRLRSIIRGILLENESNHTFEEIEKGSDFVKKCIEWCNGQRFRPDFFLKDEAIESFNCVHDLTFNTNYENLEELYRNKLTILSDNLENFESKREGINFPDSFKFSRLLKSSSRRRKDWIKPDYFYVRSFNQEDIARIKKEIEEGEQEYDVFIGDDPDLSDDDYDFIEKSRSSKEYQDAFKKFENENPHIFKDNLNSNFIVITSCKQKCNTPPIKGRKIFGSRGKHKLTPANESNWDLSIFFVCKKGDTLVESIKDQLKNNL